MNALHVDAGCYEKWQLSMPAVFYQEAVLQLQRQGRARGRLHPRADPRRLSNYEKASAAPA